MAHVPIQTHIFECLAPGRDSEVVFQSRDGVQFRIQKKYLELSTGGFPPPELNSPPDEIVSLTESSTTLKVLFDFVNPGRHPSLRDVEFGLLADVAEAAEKYVVYAAMNQCQMCMSLP